MQVLIPPASCPEEERSPSPRDAQSADCERRPWGLADRRGDDSVRLCDLEAECDTGGQGGHPRAASRRAP